MRVVVDTNVQLALWLFSDPLVDPLRAGLMAGGLMAFRSRETDAEFAEVLGRPGLFEVAAERQARLVAHWQALATLVDEVRVAPLACRDPLDQKFLDLAFSVDATWLVTRDRDLLKLARKARRHGLDIIVPERWAEITWPAIG